MEFSLLARRGKARRGRVTTRNGSFETPAFMPVGTYGAVKTLSPEEVRACGAEIILGNTYHLYLRPGLEVIKKFGGLHRFMNWPGPILTDSGGYQVFSLAEMRKIGDEGVTFQSPLDGGAKHILTPALVMEIQQTLGSEIMMVLDECPSGDAAASEVERAVRRSTAWAKICLENKAEKSGALFAIVQGGTNVALRRSHLDELAALPFDGFALGGLAVGEEPRETQKILEEVAFLMPEAKPRYLMGVGKPEDILNAVKCGIDMFDCVLPTRNARNGQLFTFRGTLQIRHAANRLNEKPIDEDCPCPACRSYSRAYLHHLYAQNEIFGHRLLTLHNLTFYQQLMTRIRFSIEKDDFDGFSASVLPALTERRE
jgi:queuine tRNA-ribosyltransferase